MKKTVRIQKYLSEKGLASRRKAEEYLKAGLIKVNGKIVKELGLKIDPDNDQIELIKSARSDEYIYLILNKPLGYVTNLPQKGEKEAKELLPDKYQNKIHACGRLDKDSEGLLFFTNDGVIAHRLTSPKFEHEKEYLVATDQPLSSETIKKYKIGIMLGGEKLKPVIVKLHSGHTYKFILREGKKRQIRRMLNNFGYLVLKLQRIRMVNIRLENLPSGKYRLLTKNEVKNLKEILL